MPAKIKREKKVKENIIKGVRLNWLCWTAISSDCFTTLTAMNDGLLRLRSVYNSNVTLENREQCPLHLDRPISLCDTPPNGSYIWVSRWRPEPLAMRKRLRKRESLEGREGENLKKCKRCNRCLDPMPKHVKRETTQRILGKHQRVTTIIHSNLYNKETTGGQIKTTKTWRWYGRKKGFYSVHVCVSLNSGCCEVFNV